MAALGVAALVFPLGWVVPSASADDGLTHTPWQMFIPEKRYGEFQVENPNNPKPVHGDVRFYAKAEVPAEDAPGWRAAPNPDYIGFDGKVDPKFGGPNASRLRATKDAPALPCLGAVDYTYFQTVVTVPPNVAVTDFKVEFDVIDDGARISVYNSKFPQGNVVANSYVFLKGKGTKNLADELVSGRNRIVVTQLDDCPTGNNLGKASIVLNGTKVTTAAPPPPPPTPKTTPLVTNTRGDVHIATPDRLVYDFQAVGDYVLTRGTPGDVVVQARQEAFDKNPKVSINTGVALKVGADKLEFYVKPTPRFELNDVPTEMPTKDTQLPGGGSVEILRAEAKSTDVQIYWPDGNTVGRVVVNSDPAKGTGSNIDIGVLNLTKNLTYEGVLGDMNGDAANDMRVQGGDQIARPASAADLTRFGDSWRVKASESLFGDAASPVPPAAKTPEAQLTLDDLDAKKRTAADKTCKDGGVSDPLALDDCTYDVAATGDNAFVASAKTYQQAVEALPAAERQTVSALAPAKSSNAAKATGANDGARGLLSNPIVWVGLGVLVVIIVVVVIAARRRKSGSRA